MIPVAARWKYAAKQVCVCLKKQFGFLVLLCHFTTFSMRRSMRAFGLVGWLARQLVSLPTESHNNRLRNLEGL